MNNIEFDKIELDAVVENFTHVKVWLQNLLDKINCTGKPSKQLFIALDEIFTNISNYAYKDVPDTGKVSLTANFDEESRLLKIIFKDQGIEYNPLYKQDPDIDNYIKSGKIGGLGIYMAKKMVDSIEYNRENNENTLILNKKIPTI